MTLRRLAMLTGACGTIALASLTLIGCDDIRDSAPNLQSCLASTEQTILLRQMTLASKGKEQFDNCRQMRMGDDFCRGLYLDANVVVRQCMNDGGFTFLD